MAAKPSPERPSQRERDVMREIEQATGWAEPHEAPPGENEGEKRNPEESPCPQDDAQQSH
jgi:hypothetical protein